MVFVLFYIFFFCIFFLRIFAVESNPLISSLPHEYKQWFTGALLTPNAKTVPPGHPALELVIIASENYGHYDSNWNLKNTQSIWGIAPFFDFQAGFNSVIGIELIGSFITNFSQGKSSTHLQDTMFRLGFQISNDKEDSWVPDFRILIQETFPTGKYRNLNPKKKGTDLTGEGSFQTGVNFVFQKLFNQKRKHPFRLRADLGYTVPSAVNVKGLNFYGGNSSTKGTIYPGRFFTGFLFGEFSLSRTCAVALELNYLHGEKGSFSGEKKGKINVSSFDELTALPEIQYTFTKNFGIVIGGWFSVAGKNVNAFRAIEGAALFLF